MPKIKIQVGTYLTFINIVDGLPNYSGVPSYALPALQQAFADNNYEIVPDLEPVPEPILYNPAQFLQDMFASSSFENWLSNFSNFKQSGFMNAATNAKVDNDWSVVQGLYEGMATATPPASEAVASWQELADANGIPLVF